jgi:hypothetical protein
MMASRYVHAKQFQLRILRSRLGHIIRERKIARQPAALEEVFALPLGRTSQIRSQTSASVAEGSIPSMLGGGHTGTLADWLELHLHPGGCGSLA